MNRTVLAGVAGLALLTTPLAAQGATHHHPGTVTRDEFRTIHVGDEMTGTETRLDVVPIASRYARQPSPLGGMMLDAGTLFVRYAARCGDVRITYVLTGDPNAGTESYQVASKSRHCRR